MKLPEHKNPNDPNRAAKAPYNFVPLPEMAVTVDLPPDQDIYHPSEAANTGYITCTLTTVTPLYIRGMMDPEFYKKYGGKAFYELDHEQKQKRAQFFHIDDIYKPLIPGSSLRGMIRTLVEIISYSKVETVSDQQLVYRAVGDTTSQGESYRERIMNSDGDKRYTPLVKAGYIEQAREGGWQIRPAQVIGGTTFARIHINDIPKNLEQIEGCLNAWHIYIQPGSYEYQPVRGGFIRNKFSKVLRASDQPGSVSTLIKASLARSGPIASKRTEAVVFPPNREAEPISISYELEQIYREQISQEQENLLGKHGVLNEGQPVFYLMDKDKLIFFGHTMMMRLPYRQTPLDFVPAHLRKPEDTDLAQAIFGYVKEKGKGKERAYASRVFVGDARLQPSGQSNIWFRQDELITPKILASPKPTTFQHYLTQSRPDPEEVGRTKDGRPKFIKKLVSYTANTPTETVLRGHKLYWHKGEVRLSDIQEDQDKLVPKNGPGDKKGKPDKQHTLIKPVAPGIKFEFRLYFDNLSDKELGALLWALTLPGDPHKQYRHSLGMGKPYGLGAVHLEPSLFLSDRRKRYSSLFEGAEWQVGVQPVLKSDIESFIARFDHFIRQKIGEERQPSLAAVKRIQQLLQLLEWPGPDKKETRYLEIERKDPSLKRGKVNEYRDRPVLPDPLGVAKQQPGQRQARPATQTPTQARSVTPPTPQTKSAPATPPKAEATPSPRPIAVAPANLEPELSQPASETEVQGGMYLEGQVIRVEGSRVVVDIGVGEASLAVDKIVPPIRDEYDLETRFRAGKRVKAWVSGRNKKGRIQLTMQRPVS